MKVCKSDKNARKKINKNSQKNGKFDLFWKFLQSYFYKVIRILVERNSGFSRYKNI